MEKFTVHTGCAVALLDDNINTVQIIPSREMKRVSRHGLAEGLFANLRYTDAATGGKTPDQSFILNQPMAHNASILLSASNFGCGSSREHAVWALQEFGFKVIVASSFGSIFFDNCIANGLLPVVLSKEKIALLHETGKHKRLIVDLQNCSISVDNHRIEFTLEPAKRQLLLNGLSAIDLTLQLTDDIESFIQRDKKQRPWLYQHGLYQHGLYQQSYTSK